MNSFYLVHFKMSSAQETLFSLELVIDYVRFDASRGNVLHPAVGVRFLDFPTLLIYQSRQDTDLCVSPEAVSNGDKLKYYPFHKGKSCLFKISLHSLHTHLTNTPLYTMVLDVKDEIPKLIGSSLVSLAKVTERIKQDVDKHGIGTPSAYGEKLISPICNLMGKSIGAISLAYKIVSLGAHLIPHIPDNKVYKVGVTRKGERETPVDAKCARVNCDKDESERHNVLSQHLSINGQFTDVVISEAKHPGVPASTQTEHTKRRASQCEDAQELNTFCPPPLFYSSSGNNQDRENLTGLYAEMENLNIEDPEDGNDEGESSDMHEFPVGNRSRKFTSTPRIQRQETDSAQFVDVIRQLPLLNALLVELSQFNLQNPSQQPMAVHPNLAWLYTSTRETSATEAKPKIEGPKTSPKQRQCKKKGVKNSVKSGKKNEEKLQPKRTLKCGLTNTFRLRLKMVKTGETKQHKCIEYIKQDQPKRQSSTDYKPVHKPLSRGVDLDETVETLIGSIDEYMNSKTIESRSQSANEKYVASFANEDVSSIEQDKKNRVYIPSPHSDRSGQRSVSSDFKIVGENSREDRIASRRLSDEYLYDFNSLNTTDGYSPDPFSSPEPNRQTRDAESSTSSSSRPSKGLPVPAKAETSPQRSLKSTHVIRPRLRTSALSLSEDESVASGSGRCRHTKQHAPSVQRTFGKSESFDSDPSDEAVTFNRVSEDSDLLANSQAVSLAEHSDTQEERDKMGSLGLDRNYHHISELVINKLPGYTL